MNKGLIGKKLGMTQIFDEQGKVIPVTVIEAGPCVVAQVKTVETDGYNAIQLGFGDVKESKINKPEKGHFAKSKLTPKKHLREFRLDSVENINVGDELKADTFTAGDQVRYPRNIKRKRIPRRYQTSWPIKRTNGTWFYVSQKTRFNGTNIYTR